MTISIGGVFVTSNRTTEYEWILAADEHLYEAKAEGRNKVIIKTF